MKKALLILLVLLLIGCQNNASELLIETNKNNLKKEVKAFIEREKNNGIYLFSKLGEKEYLIINRQYVVQGEQASYIKAMTSELIDRTLVIKLEEGFTYDYSDSQLGKIRIFELNGTADFDTIQIYLNNKETPIDIVGT